MDEGRAKRIVAIIPARLGSKRIPNKNRRIILGKPLISYTLESAINSTKVDQVIVTTDDPEIELIAHKHGAMVIQRPKDLASDEASSESALIHALDCLERNNKFPIEAVVFLQCTSPVRRKSDIDNAIKVFQEESHDSIFSCSRFKRYIWSIGKEGPSGINFDERLPRWREQEFPHQLEENGSIYVIKPWVLRKTGLRFGGSIGVFEMDNDQSIQLDDEGDWVRCEGILSKYIDDES